MKKLLPVFLILFLLSGCSSFYHAHYRKIDKVQASGIRAENSFQPIRYPEKTFAAPDEKTIAQNDSIVAPVPASELKKDSIHFIRRVPQISNSENKTVLQPRPAKTISGKTSAPHLGEYISVFFLLLSIFAIVAGLSMIILAGVFAEPLFILAGVLYILIGGIPFWILLRSLIREKRESGPYEYPH